MNRKQGTVAQRRSRWRIALLGLLFGSGLLVACQSVQTTQSGVVGVDRTQSMSVSEAELREAAVTAYSEVLNKERKGGDLNAEPALTNRVRAIAQRLIPTTAAFRPDAPGWPWEVNVIRSDQLNAWCMPGGKIAVYSGLVTKLQLSDDELAAVMGHEIAHALREHARERASERRNSQIGLGIAVAIFGGGQGMMDVASSFYGVMFGLPHSRLHETEADRIGVELAARAGYDPRAAVRLWQKMGQATAGGGKSPELLSTHPSAETRTQDLEVYAARVQPLYEQARRGR